LTKRKETTVMMMDEDTEPSSADVVLIDDHESDPSNKKRKTFITEFKTDRLMTVADSPDWPARESGCAEPFVVVFRICGYI